MHIGRRRQHPINQFITTLNQRAFMVWIHFVLPLSLQFSPSCILYSPVPPVPPVVHFSISCKLRRKLSIGSPITFVKLPSMMRMNGSFSS